jgi:hypothetical protein
VITPRATHPPARGQLPAASLLALKDALLAGNDGEGWAPASGRPAILVEECDEAGRQPRVGTDRGHRRHPPPRGEDLLSQEMELGVISEGWWSPSTGLGAL